MDLTPEFWRGKRVFLTGHTGFKGGWLSLWLKRLGAELHGFALPPNTEPNLYSVADVKACLSSETFGDLLDAETLNSAMRSAEPEIILHMAAQSLVRESYRDPAYNFAVNVMGTVNVLEAARTQPSLKAVVNVTTDKCYENKEWPWPYRESDNLGGADPYSSSKACAELVTQAYRRSFLGSQGVAIATARAGNVIGGGDWAADRLVPDVLRCLDNGATLLLRSPNALRPWQHVLEPLNGYLRLAEALFTHGSRYAEAWNFGPGDTEVRSVAWVVEQLNAHAPHLHSQFVPDTTMHEAQILKLDSAKAAARLNWRPRWPLSTALSRTYAWHRAWKDGLEMHAYSIEQIADYEAGA